MKLIPYPMPYPHVQIKDTNDSLMGFLSSKIKMIYFGGDQLSYHFFSSSNKRKFASLSSFVVSNCENLVGQSKLLVKKCYLSKKLKQNLLKELDTLLQPDKTLALQHDFQTNEQHSKLLAIHVAIEILAKMNEPPPKKAADKELQTFESKEDNAKFKSVSRLMMRK